MPKQRRQYLGSRGACDCQKASRPWRGVPGCGPLLCPPSRSALIFSARRMAAGEGRRALHDTAPVTNFEGGSSGGEQERGGHPALLSIELPASSHRLSRIARSHAALAQTPRGGFGNPSSDPNVCAQSRTKAHQRRRLPAESSGCRVPFLLVCSSRN